MSAAAWLQFVVVIAAVLVTAVPLGRYMAWAYGDGARPRRPRLPARRAIYISAVPDRPRHRAAMDHLRLHTVGFSIFSFVGVCAATRPGIPAGQPGRALGSGASSLLQHRGQLHDQHQLAGSGSPCSSPTSPRPWPRAVARPRRPPFARRGKRPSPSDEGGTARWSRCPPPSRASTMLWWCPQAR